MPQSAEPKTKRPGSIPVNKNGARLYYKITTVCVAIGVGSNCAASLQGECLLALHPQVPTFAFTKGIGGDAGEEFGACCIDED